MKTGSKFLALLVLVVGFAVATQAQTTYATDGISVTINGERVAFDNQQPVLVDGRTLVPVRGVFEALGFEVDWISATQTVTLDRSDFAVRITIGSDAFTTNGTNHTLDVPAQTISGSTMLPIRAVLESVGYHLDWDGASQTVLIGDTPFYVTIGGEQFSTELTIVRLAGRNLTSADITQLRYMVNLTEIHLSGNQITDLTPLANLTNLTWLELGGNQISDISPIANLTNLYLLDFQNNQISDISPLANLINLRILSLNFNQVSDLTPLSGLVDLDILALWDNQITDITPLAGLNELIELWLAYNQITDWSPVSHVQTIFGRD